jgi:hypothetical protein
MNRLRLVLLALFLTSSCAAFAQQSTDAATSPAEAKQFDFMLGQWELQVHPKVSSLVAMIHGTPKLIGTWKAWHVADSADIEDEIVIVDSSGNPLSSSHSLRSYGPAQRHWKITGRDTDKGRTNEATAQLQGGEMHQEGYFSDANGKTLTRTRYYDITADSFRMVQDRSSDNGQSWEEGALTVDAKRVATTATPG